MQKAESFDHLESARIRLLSQLSSNSVAFESASKIDRLLRSSAVGDELLTAISDFQLLVVPSREKTAVLESLTYRARRATQKRFARSRVRSLWGVTPILTLPLLAKSDKILGVESETLVFTTYYISSDFDINLKPQMDWILENHPAQLSAYQWMVFFWGLLTYDIFHFFNDRGLLANVGGYGSARFGISLEEMQLLKRSGKRLYTYAYGADHRMRNATLSAGKFNFCMDCPEVGKFCLCDDLGGRAMLTTIGSYATAMLATGRSMDQIPNAINLHYLIADLDDPKFNVNHTYTGASEPLRIAHAPNHGFFKGTKYLDDAVARLKAKGVPLELVKISGVPNEQVLALVASCDVLADQFISGAFGYAAIEGMALGVPVLCYLAPEVKLPEPDSVPIINCHPEHIEETIFRLVNERASLRAIGERSKDYVRKHYSVGAFSHRLKALYLETGSFPLAVQKWLRSGAEPSTLNRLVINTVSAWCMIGPSVRHALYPLAYHAKRNWAAVIHLGRRIVSKIGRVFINAFTLGVLIAAAAIGRVLTRWRFYQGRPRTLWGVTPIVTLPLLARCDRLLGLRSESVVLSTYYVTKEFDINFESIRSKVLNRYPKALRVLEKLILAWALLRYDIFHLFCDRGLLSPSRRMEINPTELNLYARSGKFLFTYTYGADVRTRDETLNLGKYNLCRDCPEPGRFCQCSSEENARNLALINKVAARMVSMGDMLAYVPKAKHLHYWPLDIKRVQFVGSQWRPGNPLRIGHVPNHGHFKGTAYLIETVDRLRDEGWDIELLTAQGVPNEAVLEIYAAADIVADQFVAGFNGYAALEAMALGKPVLCFIRDQALLLEGDSCPIINANPDCLYAVLKQILEGRINLDAIGRASRNYIEKNCSLEAVATRIGSMYREVLPASALSSLRQKALLDGVDNGCQ